MRIRLLFLAILCVSTVLCATHAQESLFDDAPSAAGDDARADHAPWSTADFALDDIPLADMSLGVMGIQQQILAFEANEHQQRINELIRRYEMLTDPESEGSDPSGDKVERLVEELQAAIEKAFDVRQNRQQQHIRQLLQRLDAVQQRLNDRQNRRQQIVEQVVQGLLSTDGPERDKLLRRALGLNRPGPAQVARGMATAKSSGYVLRAQVEELQRAKALAEKGYITHGELEALRTKVTLALEQKAVDRNRLAIDLRRREFELRKAELELAATAEELRDVKSLDARSATSEAQVRQLQLKHDQAKIDIQRAQLELEAAAAQLKTFAP